MQTCRIVVLGGPAAGKTVFVASLYHHLWQGTGSFSMRAATGSMHSDLLALGEQLCQGNMPPATQALRHFEFELKHGARTYSLRFLDYPGELFRKVFYDTAVDSEEARELYDLSTSADGIIALVDPASMLDGTWDIDFALSNLLRFYSSEGRNRPKMVIAFTKRDKTEALVGHRVASFVNRHLPHVASELGRGMRLQHFCSFIESNGGIKLSQADTIAAPLRSVIDAIEVDDAQKRRDYYMRRLAWQRSLTAWAIALLALLAIISAFVLGVVCRDSAAKPSDSALTIDE